MQNKQVYNKLPKRVNQKDFNRFIKPHLSKPSTGPKPKVSLYKIFNYIMYVLSTGCQWREVPIYRNEITWTNIYKWHNRWSKDGTYLNLLEATVHNLKIGYKLKLARIHGDATNTVAKKGELA